MEPRARDAVEFRFLTAPEASVECRLVVAPDGPELQLFGNRAGLLSLANVLLWLVANAWRREALALEELGFVRAEGRPSVCIRLADGAAPGTHGSLRQRAGSESLEWAISEEGLRQVALWVHRLVSKPGHEYDRLLVAPESQCGVHVRMTDAAEWLGRGIA